VWCKGVKKESEVKWRNEREKREKFLGSSGYSFRFSHDLDIAETDQ